MAEKSNKKIVIVSGYFNPLHRGHVNLFTDAKRLGDHLVVIINNDEQVKIKGSFPFMDQDERMEIVMALKPVDEVFLSIDKDGFQGESLQTIVKKYPGCEYIFANGGDREFSNLPKCEQDACIKFNIKAVNCVGGGKIQSSSWLISRANEKKF